MLESQNIKMHKVCGLGEEQTGKQTMFSYMADYKVVTKITVLAPRQHAQLYLESPRTLLRGGDS